VYRLMPVLSPALPCRFLSSAVKNNEAGRFSH